MMKKILIGSCGGLVGSYLARYYKKMGYRVFGFDTNSYNQTKFFVDNLFILPNSNEDTFINQLIIILNENNIDYYLPTHSTEIRKVSEFELYISQNTKTKFLVSPYITFSQLDNKHIANKKLLNVGIQVPLLYTKSNPPSTFPIIAKYNIGSGSKGFYEISSIDLYNSFCLDNSISFYKKIQGEEYTVDCFFDNNCNLVAYNQRKRIKNLGGAVIVTKNDYSFDIYPYLKIIIDNFKFKGCVNFQYILCDSVPYFIDINLRFPSGGLPLTVESGINIPKLYLDVLDERRIENIQSNPCNNKTMYRYFEEFYEE